MKITEEAAHSFAQEWIAAWNSHDLSAIMGHYSDNIQFYSPYIIRLGMNDDGLITDKPTLEAYFARGLNAYPDLHFDLNEILVGIDSVILYYTSVSNRKSGEFMQLDEEGKICLVKAHYNN
ncbi:nuclear transport factor 2 family protein [Dyadobacter luticola]|uniref:Nuclear transport factor 2 family protein n=1 Tax=Dyadobacter luticola TaxID=1979387 RepID=A0A5R9L493_9BACT|nr:nuclear transport factor 2 family protein [Dyadobacter luticola]TLV03095.1 nuclear transport factor 2 family protein [Dyadobacter luticola]